MSDFFGNLAARSLQPDPTGAPVLQPRLPSLFEPPTGAEPGGVPGFEPSAERTVSAQAPHPDNEPDLQPDPQLRAQRSTILPDEPIPTRRHISEREPPAPPESSRPEPLAVPPDLPDEPTPTRRHISERKPPAPPESSPPEPLAVPPERTIQTRFEREVVVREQSPATEPGMPPQPGDQDSKREPASSPGEEPSGSPSRRAQRMEELALDENPVERTIRPRVALVPLQLSAPKDLSAPASIPQVLRQAESAPQAESPQDATVRIHIGRIEVRAVSAPQPVQAARVAPPPHGPKLTLDDYLRQRNEGKR